MNKQYDLSGKWPVTPDGWQVISVGRTLYPGGPFACKVVTPAEEFFFGINFEPASGPIEKAVVTNLGQSSIKLPFHQVLQTDAARSEAQAKIRAYLLAHWQLFYPHQFLQVEFRAGDGRLVDIF